MSADASALDGNGDEAGVADGDDHDVCSHAVGPFLDVGREVVALRCRRGFGTHRTGRFEARRSAARHNAGSGEGRERAVDEADRTGSQHENAGVGADWQTPGGAQAA